MRWLIAWVAGATAGGCFVGITLALHWTPSEQNVLGGLLYLAVALAIAYFAASIAVKKVNRWLEKQ